MTKPAFVWRELEAGGRWQEPQGSRLAQCYLLVPCCFVLLLKLRGVNRVLLNYCDRHPQERTSNESVQVMLSSHISTNVFALLELLHYTINTYRLFWVSNQMHFMDGWIDRNPYFQVFNFEIFIGTCCGKVIDFQGSNSHFKRSDRHVVSSCSWLKSYFIY